MRKRIAFFSLTVFLLSIFFNCSACAEVDYYSLGMERFETGYYKQAVSFFSIAGETYQNSSAENNLGYCYAEGLGTEQDYTKAVECFLKAAEQGNISAENNLGYCYLNGAGVGKDDTKAVEWFKKSAEQGDAYGQSNLAYCYLNGLGVEKNYEMAAEWYGKSAEQGNACGQNGLGYCYSNGLGIQKDSSKATEWYKKSAEQGNEASVFFLEMFENQEFSEWSSIALGSKK